MHNRQVMSLHDTGQWHVDLKTVMQVTFLHFSFISPGELDLWFLTLKWYCEINLQTEFQIRFLYVISFRVTSPNGIHRWAEVTNQLICDFDQPVYSYSNNGHIITSCSWWNSDVSHWWWILLLLQQYLTPKVRVFSLNYSVITLPGSKCVHVFWLVCLLCVY